MKGLDLFSGAGGASRGYADAGFTMTGVDHRPMPRYPYEFIQADVFDIIQDRTYIDQFDLIHASPPCQYWSSTKHLTHTRGKVDALTPICDWASRYPDKIWVIENVEEAPFPREYTIYLCGSMFEGLHGDDPRRQLRRHRKFYMPQSQLPRQPYCQHNGFKALGVYGNLRDSLPGGGQTASTLSEASRLMGIDWMVWRELREAIPPAYTRYIGEHLVEMRTAA